MSSIDPKAVDAFSWIADAGTRWGVVAGGTVVVVVLVVIVLILCMRGEKDGQGYEKSRSPYFEDKESGRGIPGGMVTVPIHDGIASMTSAPPPYHSLTNTQKVQPGSMEKGGQAFGIGAPYTPQVLAPPPNGVRPHMHAPPPYDIHSLSPGLDDFYSSSSEDEEEQVGKLWFRTQYDPQSHQLDVNVLKARIHLAGDRVSSNTEIFVKVTLLPAGDPASPDAVTYRTRPKRKTMTPKYNEKFTFQVSPRDHHTHVLRLSACINDKHVTSSSRDASDHVAATCLGHVLVTLEDLEHGEVEVHELGPNPEPSQLGEINFSMSYHPQTEKLKLTINKCRNLKRLRSQEEEAAEPPFIYVKTQLICGRKQLDIQTSTPQPADLDLDFNEKMTFTLTQKQLRTASLVITVMRQKPEHLDLPFEEIYSSVTVGPYMFLHREALRHWQEMLTYPRTRITHWHGLR